jgi:hypothetical protein
LGAPTVIQSSRVYEAVKEREAILAYEQMGGLREDGSSVPLQSVWPGRLVARLVGGAKIPLTACMKSRT